MFLLCPGENQRERIKFAKTLILSHANERNFAKFNAPASKYATRICPSSNALKSGKQSGRRGATDSDGNEI